MEERPQPAASPPWSNGNRPGLEVNLTVFVAGLGSDSELRTVEMTKVSCKGFNSHEQIYQILRKCIQRNKMFIKE